MPVTELAQLRLLGGGGSGSVPNIDKQLLSDFQRAQQVLSRSSGHQFQFYQCTIEDPGLVYIIGSWDSIAFHREEFLPSAENQELLALLRDRVDVRFMFHVDIDVNININLNVSLRTQARRQVDDSSAAAAAEEEEDGKEPKPVNLAGHPEAADQVSSNTNQAATPGSHDPSVSASVVVVLLRYFISSSNFTDLTSRASFDTSVEDFHSFMNSNGGAILGSGWRINEEDTDKISLSSSPPSSTSSVDHEYVLFLSWSEGTPITQTRGYIDHIADVRHFCDRGLESKHLKAIEY